MSTIVDTCIWYYFTRLGKRGVKQSETVQVAVHLYLTLSTGGLESDDGGVYLHNIADSEGARVRDLESVCPTIRLASSCHKNKISSTLRRC